MDLFSAVASCMLLCRCVCVPGMFCLYPLGPPRVFSSSDSSSLPHFEFSAFLEAWIKFWTSRGEWAMVFVPVEARRVKGTSQSFGKSRSHFFFAALWNWFQTMIIIKVELSTTKLINTIIKIPFIDHIRFESLTEVKCSQMKGSFYIILHSCRLKSIAISRIIVANRPVGVINGKSRKENRAC